MTIEGSLQPPPERDIFQGYSAGGAVTAKSNLVRTIGALRPWQLSALCIALSEIIVSGMSLLLRGYVASDYLITGFVAALFVSYSVLQILSVSRSELEERVKERTKTLRVWDTAIAESVTAFAMADLEGKATFANRAWLNLWGYENEREVLGLSVFEFWRDQEKVQDGLDALMKRGTWSGELVAVRRDGSVRDIHLTTNIVFDADGRPICMMGSFLDITEGKLAEDRLRQFRALVEASTEFIGMADLQGRLIYLNPAATKLLGLSGQEVTSKVISDFVMDEDKARVEEEILPTMFRDGFWHGEFRFRHFVTGAPVPVDQYAFVIADPRTGQPIALANISHDITERKRAEAISLRLGRIVEDSVNEIYVFDSSTLRFLQVNRGARENLGYSEEELLHMTPLDIKPRFTRESFEELIRPLRESRRQQVVFQTTHRRKDGSLYDVEVRLQLFPTETPPVFIAIIQDITERMSTEEQLRQAKKMEAVGKLTGGVAHDFNNLLAIVGGNLELLEEKLADTPDLHDLAVKALRAVERGATLTRSLLAFSRQQPLSPRVVDLRNLVQEMADLVRRTVPETIEIEVVAGTGLWKCEADPGQLQNALLNLVANARDAMPQGGRLTIETANTRLDDEYAAAQTDVAPGQYVMLAVSDTGQGMPPEVVARAFDPFFTTKGLGKGSGLGLSMVYGFAKQSNGYAKIYSEVGHGSTVRIYLPRSTAAFEESAPTMPAGDVRSKGETILVVEDDPDVRSLTCGLLRSFGYEVFEAGDPQGALRTVRDIPRIALLLIDVVLPGGMNGPRLAEEVLRLRPEIEVLYMSGYTENAVLHHGRLDPGVHLLQKPFTKRDLASKIRILLDRKKS